MELSWKNHGILFLIFCGNTVIVCHCPIYGTLGMSELNHWARSRQTLKEARPLLPAPDAISIRGVEGCSLHLSHDMTKPTKWLCSVKTQISLGFRPVWSVFAVRMKKPWVLSYPLSAQQRLIRLFGFPGWSESSLGAHSFCWFCHKAAHLICFCLSNIFCYMYC